LNFEESSKASTGKLATELLLIAGILCGSFLAWLLPDRIEEEVVTRRI
jgi:F0F1-type ATP synthase assembly protein I